MFPVLVRTTIIYLFLIIAIRLTGKRQVGELQLSELITAFLISEVAAAPLSDPDVPLLYAIIPIVTLICLEIIISFLITKSVLFKKIFESPPTVLISKGKLNAHALQKQRLTCDELISSLRQKDVADISDIEYCFLEHNGQISSFKKEDGLTLPVIIDGKTNSHFLKILDRDPSWLRARLAADKKNVSELLLATTDGKTIQYVEKTNPKGK